MKGDEEEVVVEIEELDVAEKDELSVTEEEEGEALIEYSSTSAIPAGPLKSKRWPCSVAAVEQPGRGRMPRSARETELVMEPMAKIQ